MAEDFDYRKVVEQILDARDWKYTSKFSGDKEIFILPFGAKNTPSIRLLMTVDSRGDVKLNSYLANEVSPEKFPEMIETLNNLNSQYRYVTLSIDDDGDILAQYDFTIFGTDFETIDKQVRLTVFLVAEVMDQCCPEIMKTIWKD